MFFLRDSGPDRTGSKGVYGGRAAPGGQALAQNAKRSSDDAACSAGRARARYGIVKTAGMLLPGARQRGGRLSRDGEPAGIRTPNLEIKSLLHCHCATGPGVNYHSPAAVSMPRPKPPPCPLAPGNAPRKRMNSASLDFRFLFA